MKLFGFGRKNKVEEFQMTDDEKIWIEDNLYNLIQLFGLPCENSKWVQYDERSFPRTFKDQKFLVGDMIADLCDHLEITKKVSFIVESDIRDTYGIPYEMEGVLTEASLECQENEYVIHVANQLKQHPSHFIKAIINEALKIKLLESNANYQLKEISPEYVYITGVYFGFGIILCQNQNASGQKQDGDFVRNWSFPSLLGNNFVGYCLALYSLVLNSNEQEWKGLVPQHIEQQLRLATSYLDEHPKSLFEPDELKASALLRESNEFIRQNRFQKAIESLEQFLKITKQADMKANAYNDIGYYMQRLSMFEESLAYFANAIAIDPLFAYPYDNTGYSLLRLGKLDEGRKWVEHAMVTQNNELSYSMRNLGLYHFYKGELEKADVFFQRAFESIVIPVDLLEYHYSELLFAMNRSEEALRFLSLSADKGEPEAIKKLGEIN